MRIGVAMLGVPAPAGRDREVTAYSRRLAEALLRRDSGDDFVLYAGDDLPLEDLPNAPGAAVARTGGESSPSAWLDRVAREDPDALDWLVLLDPFDPRLEQGPPARPLDGVKVAAVVHDLVPFLFQERELPDPALAPRRYRSLERIKQYDVLLAPSESTRADCLRLLGLPADRVQVVGVAGDPLSSPPGRSEPLPAAARRELYRLGIRRSFVLALAGPDGRQNLAGLVEAFRALPDRLRRGFQLAIAGPLSDVEAGRLRGLTGDAQAPVDLVLTGAIPDETLRILVQRCSVFVSPSTYEGSGLSVVEALGCGAVVVAGNNTAQREVLGEAGLLANAGNAAEMAEVLGRALDDWPLAQKLRELAPRRAAQFSWDETAGRVLDALRQPPAAGRRRRRADGAHGPRGGLEIRPSKPRIAFFSPLPPKISGISDYAVRLLAELKDAYTIDLYHDAGYVPDLGLSSCEFGCFDHRLFDRNDAVIGYHAVVYQMGNSVYHGFLYDTLQRRPGVVTLHDFCLSAFQHWYAHLRGWGIEGFRREVAYNFPDRADELLAQEDQWRAEEGGIPVACARRGVFLNRRVFEHARTVAVHSPWCVDQVRRSFPAYAERTAVIPMGATLSLRTPEQRAAIRARFAIDGDALVIASFGILSGGKMNHEAVTAFARIAEEFPRAVLLFVGEEWDGGQTRRAAERLGIGGRVRFLGRQAMADFLDLIAVADVGVALRRPPTDGETSAALLDLLRSGIPTITTDVGTFSGYPADVVVKVRWPAEGIDGLAGALRRLASDPAERARRARAAVTYVGQNHSWPRAAARYIDLIERSARPRRLGRPVGPGAGPRARHSALAKDPS